MCSNDSSDPFRQVKRARHSILTFHQPLSDGQTLKHFIRSWRTRKAFKRFISLWRARQKDGHEMEKIEKREKSGNERSKKER